MVSYIPSLSLSPLSLLLEAPKYTHRHFMALFPFLKSYTGKCKCAALLSDRLLQSK
jgi:hypothetical protein